MGYDESANDPDVEDERPVGRAWLFVCVAVTAALFAGIGFMKAEEERRTLTVAPQSDVALRLDGVVTARSGNVGGYIGAQCTVDIANLQRGGRACNMHVMCDGREQGFIAARCPLDPDIAPDARHVFAYEAFDGNHRSLGHVTLELSPH